MNLPKPKGTVNNFIFLIARRGQKQVFHVPRNLIMKTVMTLVLMGDDQTSQCEIRVTNDWKLNILNIHHMGLEILI
jgi:hypothetical protein